MANRLSGRLPTVALLAFLQAAWNDIPILVPYIAFGIAALTLGLAFAAAVPFVRVAASLHYQNENFDWAKCYSFSHRLLEKLSIVTFVVGVLVVVIGVFANLPEIGQATSNLQG